MSGLFSKVLAGGVSAGIFLLWWPAHVTAQGSEWLFVRGILWSLAFEILLFAYSPLEKAIVRAVREREPRTLRGPQLARILTFAVLAVAVPLVMLSGTKPPSAAPARAAGPAQKVIVKREIVKREVVVRRVNKVVRVPGPTVTTPAPAATPVATAATPAARKTAPKTTTSGQVVGSSTKDAQATKATKPTASASTTAPTATPAAPPTATASSSGSATAATSGAATPSAANAATTASTSAAGS
jgi:hypothetical protein